MKNIVLDKPELELKFYLYNPASAYYENVTHGQVLRKHLRPFSWVGFEGEVRAGVVLTKVTFNKSGVVQMYFSKRAGC